MSALGHNRKSNASTGMSALGDRADVIGPNADVRLEPEADVSQIFISASFAATVPTIDQPGMHSTKSGRRRATLPAKTLPRRLPRRNSRLAQYVPAILRMPCKTGEGHTGQGPSRRLESTSAHAFSSIFNDPFVADVGGAIIESWII